MNDRNAQRATPSWSIWLAQAASARPRTRGMGSFPATLAALVVLLTAVSACAQSTTSPLISSFEPTPDMQLLAQRLIREHLPAEFVDERKWDRTKEFHALRLRRDDGRLQLRRVEREFKHGRWKKYKATLINPEQDFHVRLGTMHRTPEGPIAVQIHAEGRMNGFVRFANWRRGVMLYSVSADADAKVRLTLNCDVELVLDPSKLPPDVVIKARARDANIELVDFRLNSVSELRGDLAKGLGKLIDDVVADSVADANDKLVKKVNDALDKRSDKMRLSASSLLSSAWGDLLTTQR